MKSVKFGKLVYKNQKDFKQLLLIYLDEHSGKLHNFYTHSLVGPCSNNFESRLREAKQAIKKRFDEWSAHDPARFTVQGFIIVTGKSTIKKV